MNQQEPDYIEDDDLQALDGADGQEQTLFEHYRFEVDRGQEPIRVD